MEAPTEIKIAFDPIGAGIVSFTNETAKIIWCCIKHQHVVDQNFDNQVFVFAEGLEENLPEFYRGFKEKVRGSNLRQFGRRTIREFGFKRETILDDNFWIGVWEYIKGWKTLKIKMI